MNPLLMKTMQIRAKASLLWTVGLTPAFYFLGIQLLPGDAAFKDLAHRGCFHLQHYSHTQDSKLLNIDDVKLTEPTVALNWLLSHADSRAFFVLLALRRDFPEAYQSVPGAIRLRILTEGRRNMPVFVDMWGWDFNDRNTPTLRDSIVALRELDADVAKSSARPRD